MRHKVVLPRLGETVDEVEVLSWEVVLGEIVVEGQPLMVAATDKIDVDLPAPVGGKIVDILVDVGSTITTGTTICVIEGTT
jgi:2-oxoglutarate dehydrogenase E2 component (dihydrolipoamide succinyltransferase)